MKKFHLLLLLCVLSISCSKDDDSANSNISINPPDWLHGTWKNETSDYLQFQFTATDIVQISGGVYLSHKEQLSSYAEAGAEVSVDETVSPDVYKVSLNYPQGTTQVYHFEKIDDNSIIWINTGMGSMQLQKQ